MQWIITEIQNVTSYRQYRNTEPPITLPTCFMFYSVNSISISKKKIGWSVCKTKTKKSKSKHTVRLLKNSLESKLWPCDFGEASGEIYPSLDTSQQKHPSDFYWEKNPQKVNMTVFCLHNNPFGFVMPKILLVFKQNLFIPSVFFFMHSKKMV